MRFAILFVATFLLVSESRAQDSLPSVTEIMKRHDGDKDGLLSAKEVAGSQFARQFSRWDKDRDGKVSDGDVIKYRRRFGISADGSKLRARHEFPIPEVDELPRVDRDHGPGRQAAQQSAYILNTEPHEVSGTQYVILTDHKTSGYLDPLRRLAQHHRGSVIEVDDLSNLNVQEQETHRVREQLADAKYVAIAMRKESFRENTLLGLWELLSTIDADEQVDVWPGLLLASDESSFATLIDQSIDFQSLSSSELNPVAISQVQRNSETRSLQKAGVLRKAFEQFGLKTPVIAIYGQQAKDAPRLPGEQVWNLTVPDNREFVKEFPAPVSDALADSGLWILHGHGIPGMSCSIDIDGLPEDMSGKIVLSGSCFSAAPWQSDLPRLREAPGGYQVEQRDAFSIRAVDQGAVVVFGHQRLSSGFPHLYPVLEAWTKGQTVGQAYQQLLNGLIDRYQTKSGDFLISDSQQQERRLPQNRLLYVVIGDPALQPMERLR